MAPASSPLMRARTSAAIPDSRATISKARERSVTAASSAVATPYARWIAARPRRRTALSIEGRSSSTREAAWTYSTATATASGPTGFARTSSPAASATSGRMRFPGERTASETASRRRSAPRAGDGSSRASAASSPGREAAANRSKGNAGGLRRVRGEGLRLGLVDVENGNELRDGQHVGDLRRQAEELQLSTLVRHGGIAADELSDSGRIDGGHFLHVDQDVFLSLLDETVDDLAQLDVPGADRDLPLQIHDRDPLDPAHIRLHVRFPSFSSPEPKFLVRTISMPPPSSLRKRTSSMNVFM